MPHRYPKLGLTPLVRRGQSTRQKISHADSSARSRCWRAIAECLARRCRSPNTASPRYVPETHVAFDERIKKITAAMEYSFALYDDHERFYRELAHEAGCSRGSWIDCRTTSTSNF